MSAAVGPSAPPRAPRYSAADPRVRFRDLAAAEWTKLSSLRSTRYVLGAGVLLLMLVAAQKSTAAYDDWPNLPARERAHFDPLRPALSQVSAILLVVGSGVVGALALVGEFATGLIRTTFTAVPARHRVVLAKVTVVAAVMLAVGVLVALSTFAVSQAILSGRGVALSVNDPGVPRVLAANALLAPLAALVGMGIGALLRHTAGTVVAVIVLLVILPMMAKPNAHQWVNDVYKCLPLYDWAMCLSQRHPRGGAALPTVAGSWLAFACCALAAVAVAVVVVRRRDV
ncbi:ABC transporter permease [Actinomadura logoneensis]|uniref:ABC transporter permease n=1 Tax=Actinomadura logoneensis TaxID=2293572 RepID=A0A372JGD1_9ACTN|nr:ABC transporter permease subunit [Actinomadura logoneensis]RFU39062.1 ABC transporter permease [Actinomadura logoneensis]